MCCDCITGTVGRYIPFKVRVVIGIVGVFCGLLNIVPQTLNTNIYVKRNGLSSNFSVQAHRQQKRFNQKDAYANLVSTKVIPRGSLSTRGWWMSHVTWDVEQIKMKRSVTKSLVVLGTKCSLHRTLDTYQYIKVENELPVQYLHFTVSSASWNLRVPHTVKRYHSRDPFYEARLYVVLSDGATRLVKLEFEPRHRSTTVRRANFIVPPDKNVSSVMVVLACFGYKGYVAFKDITVTPLIDGERKFNSSSHFTSRCPPARSISHLSASSSIAFSSQVICSEFSSDDRNDITMVTQLTLDRVNKLKMALKEWDGPISIAIYVVIDDDSKEEQSEARDVVTEKLNPSMFSKFSTVHVTVLYGNQGGARYPINYLRNVALGNVKTKYVFVTDVDFIPSRGLPTKALAKIEAYTRKNRHKNPYVCFVVPAFQFNSRMKSRLPKSRRHLKKLVEQESPLSHSPTDYDRWYTSSIPFEARDYQDKYEPYMIRLTQDYPLFDERFTGYGMNKISNIMELYFLGHKFVVLPDVWIIHCYHRSSKLSFEHRMNPDTRFMNRLKRFEFLSEMNCKHGLRNRGKDKKPN